MGCQWMSTCGHCIELRGPGHQDSHCVSVSYSLGLVFVVLATISIGYYNIEIDFWHLGSRRHRFNKVWWGIKWAFRRSSQITGCKQANSLARLSTSSWGGEAKNELIRNLGSNHSLHRKIVHAHNYDKYDTSKLNPGKGVYKQKTDGLRNNFNTFVLSY